MTRSSRTTASTGATGATTFQLTLHVQDEVRVTQNDGQHLPDEHPPRLCGQRIDPVGRR